MAYACRVIADSISPAGHRLTSWEATFPRIILAEVNTHCMLSRNSASSRARPVASVIAAVRADPFVPASFGRNQRGMQPGEALEGEEAEVARLRWLASMEHAAADAAWLAERGVHKQYANRLLEPFAWHTAVITATDVGNLFNLRVSPLAQGEFQTAARMMREALEASEPRAIGYGEWHLPYVEPGEAFDLGVEGRIDPVKVSVMRCARVSYMRQGEGYSPQKDHDDFDSKLLEPGHMSPLEHAARPMTQEELDLTHAYDVALDDGPTLRWSGYVPLGSEPFLGQRRADLRTGRERIVTFVRGPLHYAGKLNGWISRRQHVRGEHDIVGHRAAAAE